MAPSSSAPRIAVFFIAVAAASTGLAAPSAPDAHAAPATTCTAKLNSLVLDPGIQALENASGTYHNAGTGTVDCTGPVQGRIPTGPGMWTRTEGKYSGTCATGGTGTFTHVFKIPTNAGPVELTNTGSFTFGALKGGAFGGEFTGTTADGSFSVLPNKGNCVSSAVTDFSADLRMTLLTAATAVRATGYADMDRAGPTLRVSRVDLDASLTCVDNLRGADAEPVLLVPGTGVTDSQHFGWNYAPAFQKQGRPYCSLNTPDHELGDMQVSAEYVVDAIRTMYARAGRRIAILGGSQGGSLPRWALRFWPDTRAMVADEIGLGGSNHGGHGVAYLCVPDSAIRLGVGCAPALLQQTPGSTFMAALNSGAETFPGIDYTEIGAHSDVIVAPEDAFVHGPPDHVADIAVDEMCPGHVADHQTLITFDPVAYALVIDALDHDGPADPHRVDHAVCNTVLPPTMQPETVLAGDLTMLAVIGYGVATMPRVAAEPPLRCYVTDSC